MLKKKKTIKDVDQDNNQDSEKNSVGAGISGEDRQTLIQKLEGHSMFSQRSNSISEKITAERDSQGDLVKVLNKISDSKHRIKMLEYFQKKQFLQSEYFFDNKGQEKQKNLPNINFDKVPGRKEPDSTYNQIDGTHEKLFPSSLSQHSKLHANVDFRRSIGRDEHGMNLEKRKIQRLSAEMLYTKESKEKSRLIKLHEEAGKQVRDNLRRDYNLISDKPPLQKLSLN